MKKNPRPLSTKKGVVTRESGAKPKPHEYITAEALADAGYSFVNRKRKVIDINGLLR